MGLTISACGLFSKLTHVYAVKSNGSIESFNNFMKKYRAPKEEPVEFWFPDRKFANEVSMNLTPTYYGHPEYTIESGFLNKNVDVDMPVKKVNLIVEGKENFGKVSEEKFILQKKSIIITNIQAFPWNKIILNNIEVASEETYSKKSLYLHPEVKKISGTVGLSVIADKGENIISYKFSPDQIWVNLIKISWIVIILWSSLVMYFSTFIFISFLKQKTSEKF